MSNLPKEVREAICAEIEESLMGISVGEDADGMSYGLIDAIAEARHETELSGAGDILRDASADILDAALSALGEAGYAVMPKEPTEAMQEAVAQIPILVGNAAGPVHIPTAYVRELLAAMLSASQEQSDV